MIDDVWNTEAWASLRRAFPDKNGSRVVITTYVYEHPVLKDEESWELFCKKHSLTMMGRMLKQVVAPHHLETLARDMVSKCRGVPLAIVVLGGLLSRKQQDEWLKLQGHILRAALTGFKFQ